MPRIRNAQAQDMRRLLQVWLNSVRATHHFLTEADIQFLFPLVRDDELPKLELWTLCDDNDVTVGFVGLAGRSLEALFIDPSYHRRGGGRLLVDHASRLNGRPLIVSVNEQNPAALDFYLGCGFEVIGRSPVDDGGRPFPLLHMRQTQLARASFANRYPSTLFGRPPLGKG
jgi:putative acetyltransferase